MAPGIAKRAGGRCGARNPRRARRAAADPPAARGASLQQAAHRSNGGSASAKRAARSNARLERRAREWLEAALAPARPEHHDREYWREARINSRSRAWQAVQPLPAPVCRQTSLTVCSPQYATASATWLALIARQWQTIWSAPSSAGDVLFRQDIRSNFTKPTGSNGIENESQFQRHYSPMNQACQELWSNNSLPPAARSSVSRRAPRRAREFRVGSNARLHCRTMALAGSPSLAAWALSRSGVDVQDL